MLPVKELKPGDKIIIRETWAQKDENQKTAPRRRVTVIKQYPHHVLVENAKGNQMLYHECRDLWDGKAEGSTGGSRDA